MLHNSEILEASSRVLSPGQVGLLAGWGVFSTIRVYDGVLFAFERHWARMHRDAELLGVPFPESRDSLEWSLLALVAANHAWNASLRVAVIRNRGGIWEGPGIQRDYDLVAFTADLRSSAGTVRLAVSPHGRHAQCPFAGVKVLSWCLNLALLEQAQRRGFDEVILLNERGEVCECTSANIFIATGDTVCTPPLGSGCLPGVTRDLLLHEIRCSGLSVSEKTLFLPDLHAADAVFITSTTRELLPVSRIEDLDLQPAGNAREKLQTAFSAYEDAYVKDKKTRMDRTM